MQAEAELTSTNLEATAPSRRRPVLTVVVPVFNGGHEIVENVAVIRAAATKGLADEDVEVVVVSDGSLDGTDEMLLQARQDVEMRVIHYDRNLGKGYAVKLGALASSGQWIAIVDADLDLDPASIPAYLETAMDEDLDFAIGSKRHPESIVHYPRSRRIASWCYQQLNRALFRLDVRDTQVGLKVFRGEVADEVVPLLLVKQFAFDLELLAVSRALGYGRVRELPVRLDYRFTGSAVRSRAAARAVADTLAIFYRLRILHTYQRKRALLARAARQLATPLVNVIADGEIVDRLDYPRLEAVSIRDVAAGAARGEFIAVLEPGGRPGGNWVSAAVPYFVDPDVAAVVVPTITPTNVPVRNAIAAAVLESRLGGGSRRSRYLPGNVRVVVDYPAHSVIVRRADYVSGDDVPPERIVSWLAEQGRKTIYTPDSSVSTSPRPFARAHLSGTVNHARARGRAARVTHGRSLSLGTALSFAPLAAALAAVALLFGDGAWRTFGIVLLVAYLAALGVSGLLAALRFRSVVVGLVVPFAVVATEAAYAFGFIRGLLGAAADTRVSPR